MANYKYTTFSISVISSLNASVNVDSTIEKNMNQKIKEMAADGWRLVSITPIIKGKHNHEAHHGRDEYGGYGWGYGYTRSLMITMEKQA